VFVCTSLLQEKVRLYQSRFNLLYQRLRRNALFAPTNPVRAARAMPWRSSRLFHSTMQGITSNQHSPISAITANKDTCKHM
jgi:hypothetical protein